MGLLDSVLKAFVGDKSKKDIGEIQPLVDAVKQHGGAMAKLSLDELRAKSDAFRAKIKEDQKEVQKQIDDLLNDSKISEGQKEPFRNLREDPMFGDSEELKNDRLRKSMIAKTQHPFSTKIKSKIPYILPVLN